MSKIDDEVRKVTAQLDVLLDSLAGNVAALNEILTRTPPPGPGAAEEKLVSPS